MLKHDLRQEFKHLYSPTARQVQFVDVPALQFVMIDGAIEAGHGPGTSPAFEAALGALYGVAYTLKFAAKQRRENPIDYPVMALEGLWWVEDGAFSLSKPDNWLWTAMIMQPDAITQADFEEAVATLRRKRGDSPALAQLRLARFHEGPAVQIMHVGPYAEEPATVARLDAYAQAHGYVMQGKHHEIYLGDPRRAAPEKLRTIVRHPVQPALVMA